MESKFLCVPADTGTMYAIPVDTIKLIGEGTPNANGPRTVIHYTRPTTDTEYAATGAMELLKVITAQESYADVIAKMKQLTQVV